MGILAREMNRFLLKAGQAAQTSAGGEDADMARCLMRTGERGWPN